MALNDEEQKALEKKLADSEKATKDALKEKDDIKGKHDTILNEKKKFKTSVKELIGEDVDDLSEKELVEKLKDIKETAKSAAKKGDITSEEMAALEENQKKLEKKILSLEDKDVKTEAAKTFAEKKAELTAELAKKEVTGDQLDDALDLAMPKLVGKDDVDYEEFVKGFLEKRPHLVSSGFTDGVESKVKKQNDKDAKSQAEAIQQKINSGQKVTPAEMKKLESLY